MAGCLYHSFIIALFNWSKLLLLTITWLILSDTLRVCLSYRRIWISLKIFLQCFFRFWNMSVTVPWPFSTIRSKALLHSWPFIDPDRSWPFLTVSDRYCPFMNVPDRSPFMTFSERFLSFLSVLCAFSIVLLALSIV